MKPDKKKAEDMRPIPSTCVFSVDELQGFWRDLNRRYFRERLQPIAIVWSRRLTASVGMFVSHVGPKAPWTGPRMQDGERRIIRLSIPLLQDQPDQEVVGTLAHEMIHQWQYDILKRHPNHGPEFCRMMVIMNLDGLGITIRHSLDKVVHALTRYTWRCTECGRDYHRQRNTIRPVRHRCGECLGKLREVPHAPMDVDAAALIDLVPPTLPHALVPMVDVATLVQMPLPFANH
jgi:predicted SprT family Zn-dependent metalloprotease